MAVDPNTKALYGTRLIVAGATLAAFGLSYRRTGMKEGSTREGRAGATDSSFYYDAPWFSQFITGLVLYEIIRRRG